MTEFQAFLRLGFEHITDANAYDHILFIVALCAVYQLPDWRRILVLVTAFTAGHSITLALATLQWFSYRADVVEFLIPVTIFMTAIANLFRKYPKPATKTPKPTAKPARPQYLRYVFAMGFGLIHGLGFSNYLQSLLGREGSIFQPLLAFNIGLELGQLLIVAVFVTLAYVFARLFNVSRRDWNLVLSGAVAGIALVLLQKVWLF